MTIEYILIVLLVVIVMILALALYQFSKKGIFVSDKERDFIVFSMNVFINYGEDLGIQSKEEHKKLTEELEKIKLKHFNVKRDEQLKSKN